MAENAKTWREVYPVHPCADVFPMLPDDEIDALAADIQTNGLRQPVVVWRADDDADAERIGILDGRNRLSALERLGVTFTRLGDEAVFPDGHTIRPFTWNHTTDPAAYVISANIRRRMLTKEQQAELIVKAIEAGQPNDSANLAESKRARKFSPTAGREGGSTANPVLTAAIAEGKKHDISRRTVERAVAKVKGPIGKVTPAPTIPLAPPPPSTYEWVDTMLTRAHGLLRQALDLYLELDVTAPKLTAPERRTVRARVVEGRRDLDRLAVHFGGTHKSEPDLVAAAARRTSQRRTGDRVMDEIQTDSVGGA